MMEKELRQFHISLVKVSLLGLLAFLPIFLFHVCIDPYGIFLRLYDHSPIEPNKRYIKIKHILNHPDTYDSFIFGNSRVNAFHTDQFPEGRFYNMSYSIGIPSYHLEEIKFLLKKGIKLKHLIIALDHSSLIENNGVGEDDLLRKKYPMNFIESLQFYTSYLFYIPSREFVKTVLRGSQFDWSELDQNGYINSTDLEYKKNPELQVSSPKFQEKLVYLDRHPNIQRDLATIRELKILAEEKGIKITFFLNPVFHTAFTTIHLPAYYKAIRELAKITPYIDFSGIHWETLDKRNYHESSHYTTTLAELMTQILFSTERKRHYTFGTYVDTSNVESHIQAHLASLNTYFQAKNLIDSSLTIPTYHFSVPPGTLNDSNVRFRKDEEPMLISSPLFSLSIQSKGPFDPSKYRIKTQGKEIPFCRIQDEKKEPGGLGKNYICWVETKHLKEGTNTLLLVHKLKNKTQIADSLTIQIAGVEGMSLDWKTCQSQDSTLAGNLEQVHYVAFPEKMAPGKIRGLANLEGWLAHSKLKQPANELFVEYENHLYPVHFRPHRDDVIQFLGAASDLHFGFYVTIPVHAEDVRRDNFQFWLLSKEKNACSIFKSK